MAARPSVFVQMPLAVSLIEVVEGRAIRLPVIPARYNIPKRLMFAHVTRVRHIDDRRLRVAFNDGTIREVDLSKRCYSEGSEPRRDVESFRQLAVHPETGTIERLNGADFAPEFLRETADEVERVA